MHPRLYWTRRVAQQKYQCTPIPGVSKSPVLPVLARFLMVSDLIIFASLMSVCDISLSSLKASGGKYLYSYYQCKFPLSFIATFFCPLAIGLFFFFLLLIFRSSSHHNDLQAILCLFYLFMAFLYTQRLLKDS